MTIDSVRLHAPEIARGIMAILLGIAGLLQASPASLAQESTSETTITIAVLPVEFTPMPTSALPAGRPAPQAGTVSSKFMGVGANDRSERPDDVVLTFVVSDDRGTAGGWDVRTNFVSTDGVDFGPTLIEGCDSTIQRILPEVSRQSNQVHGGRTLGRFESPVSVLYAAPGSGDGIYVQELIVVLPDREKSSLQGTILVHLPFAP